MWSILESFHLWRKASSLHLEMRKLCKLVLDFFCALPLSRGNLIGWEWRAETTTPCMIFFFASGKPNPFPDFQETPPSPQGLRKKTSQRVSFQPMYSRVTYLNRERFYGSLALRGREKKKERWDDVIRAIFIKPEMTFQSTKERSTNS